MARVDSNGQRRAAHGTSMLMCCSVSRCEQPGVVMPACRRAMPYAFSPAHLRMR